MLDAGETETKDVKAPIGALADKTLAEKTKSRRNGKTNGAATPTSAPDPEEKGAPRLDSKAPLETQKAPHLPPAPERDAPAGSSPPAGATASRFKPTRRKLLLLAAAAIALVAGGIYGEYWWTTGSYIVSTDDAYVSADTATIAAKVAGYVTEVDVTDNSEVHEGDVIARIDEGDYALAVQNAADQAATQAASIARIDKQIAAQQAAVAQAESQVASAKAEVTRTALELKRQQSLAVNHYASQQTLEQAKADAAKAVAAEAGAEAGVAVAKTNIDVLKAQKDEAISTLKELKTALAKAERDLSFTVVKAPFDGVIGNRAIKVGDYVQPAQRLASLVPLSHVYIDANFKETDLEGIKAGQPAEIAVDALPDMTITGKVESVAPASGSVFSLLPADNATGNFTKIVQRVPVRIAVPLHVASQELLRPGMSVEISINTKHGGTDGARATEGVKPDGGKGAEIPMASASPR